MSNVVGPIACGLTVVEVDGCFHIFNPTTQRAIALNDTASEVWRLCTGSLHEDQIVEALAKRYGTSAATIGPDVRRVVQDLSREGLLDRAKTP